MFQGVLNLDKPAGLSSARAVSRVKRLCPAGTKVGHAGTLDPFATGVLLILVGKGTRLCESLMGRPKAYETTLKLGATTATDDPESPEVVTPDAPVPEARTLSDALAAFSGTILQRPPDFSALKIGGRRAYALARAGQEVRLQPRPVRIDAIELLDYTHPFVRLYITCGRGTYIRSIARDLGESLRTGAFLTQLRRTRVGPFTIEQSIPLDTLSAEMLEASLREYTPP